MIRLLRTVQNTNNPQASIEVYFDTMTFEITNVDVSTVSRNVSYPNGAVMYQSCDSTGTLHVLKAKATAPYAYDEPVPNSPSCVAQTGPGAATAAITVNTTDETVYGAADGTITVTAVSTYPIFIYELSDRSNSNGHFINIAPGIYSITLTDINSNKFYTTATVGAAENAACHIIIQSVESTDETGIGAKDGSISIYAISNRPIVRYYAQLGFNNPIISTSNVIKGLAPGTYTLKVEDSGDCFTTGTVTVGEATLYNTNLKYRVQYWDVDDKYKYVVNIYDKKRRYPIGKYPIMLDGYIIHSWQLEQEDKASIFAPSKLQINVLREDNITADEFAFVDERTYYVEYFENNNIKFKGWLLPDQVQDLYDDPPYDFQLIATDGVLSLKSDNLTDGTMYPLFGVQSWLKLVNLCLKQVDYDYESITIAKSLLFKNEMDWRNVGVWGDLFYDDNLVPQSAYDVLEKLIGGVKCMLYQQDGRFIIADNANLLPHAGRTDDAYLGSFFQYDIDGNPIAGDTVKPSEYLIGFDGALQPVDNVPSIDYDSSFSSVMADIDFNELSLLYPNPSFELAAIEGGLPYGFTNGTNGIPNSGLTSSDALIGLYSMRVFSAGNAPNQFITSSSFRIDQVNKSAKLSFGWKVTPFTLNILGNEAGLSVAFSLFLKGDDGQDYYFQQSPYRYQDINTEIHGPYDQSTKLYWQPIPSTEIYSEGQLASFKVGPTHDFTGWQSFEATTPELPTTGYLYFRFYPAVAVPFGELGLTAANVDDNAGYISIPYSNDIYYLLDNLQISLTDSQEGYNRQIGETHTVTNLTNYAKSEKKTFDLSLFSYAANKRLAGNIFYGLNYDTALTGAFWVDPLDDFGSKMLLPGILVKQLARSYSRPMLKLEVTVKSGAIGFFTKFGLSDYEGKVFMPYSIAHDGMNGKCTLTIVETDDSPVASTYVYYPKFEKSAKRLN